MKASNNRNSTYDISFNITTVPRGTVYTIESGSFRNAVQILFSFLCSLIVALAIVRIVQWHNRNKKVSSNGQVSVDIVAMSIKTIVCLCHSYVLLMFPFFMGLATYWIIFGQIQQTLFIFRRVVDPPPLESLGIDEYQALVVFIQILFWTHTVYMIYVLCQQCNIDIVFIDWEKSHTIGSSVSMWRLLMICKEWIKLQATRKSRIEINIVTVTFIMENIIERLPLIRDFPQNVCFRKITHIILSSWVWIGATTIQLLLKNLIMERYCLQSQAQRLIDLSTIAKISTLILVEEYHGHYLHCRSPYEFADCSEEELRDYIDKENRGIYASRGIDDPAAPIDCQAFTFMASAIFRKQINKALNITQSYAAKAELESFIKSFIEQTPPPVHEGLRRKIRIPSFCERMMGSSSSEARARESGCLLYPDEKACMSDYSFLSTSFLGIERDLGLQDVLTYTFFFTVWNDLGAAVLITYVLHLIRHSLRLFFGRRNISRKGFVDLRLLS